MKTALVPDDTMPFAPEHAPALFDRIHVGRRQVRRRSSEGTAARVPDREGV